MHNQSHGLELNTFWKISIEPTVEEPGQSAKCLGAQALSPKFNRGTAFRPQRLLKQGTMSTGSFRHTPLKPSISYQVFCFLLCRLRYLLCGAQEPPRVPPPPGS